MKSKIKNLINFSRTLKILYIEDNLEAREQTLKLLKNFFSDIVVAIDGEDGLRKFKTYNPDLIFTDLNMPHMNGIDMLGEIREIDDDIPCVVISAHNESDYFINAIKIGVDGFILKPIDINQFSTLLYKIVEKLKFKKEDINHTKELETKVRERTSELARKLYFDDLTGILNRSALLEKLSQCDEKHMPIIFLIDIDSFRTYNELYGIEVGNEILKQFSTLLEQCCKSTNYALFRVFGDEFALFEMVEYIDLQKYEETVNEIFSFFSKNKIYIKSLNEYLEISITIGMSFGNKNALSKANMALFNAKSNGKKYSTYCSQIDRTKKLENNFYWRKEIKNALLEDRVIPYFQPIVDRNKKIIKYESLIRIIQYDMFKEKKIVTPFNFLDIARQTKQYDDLSYRMIEKTLALMKDKNISFSINLDYGDVYNRNLMDMLKTYLSEHKKTDINHNKVILEILEDQQIKDYQSFSKKLEKIKKLGALVAIDDFGSGYSNLSHIVGIDPQYIKIDATLVKNIDTNKNSRKIVQGIVHLAKNLGIKTIAEFVSSEKIFEIVYELGVDEFQGYYFGKPAPIDEVQSGEK